MVAPALVKMMVCSSLVVPTGWSPKLINDGDRPRKVPSPDSATVCGLPGASSPIQSEAVRTPSAVGVKIILILQLFPDGTLKPQLFCWAKSPLLAPLSVMPPIWSEELPILVIVTF